jgi:DNA-binding response OmpR family regulator
VQDTRSALNGIEPPVETAGILVVDAYGHSREGLTASLRVGGYRVESAAGSWEAIQKAKDGHFGIAVIDLDLPPAHGMRMSGWDLARIIRAFHPGAAMILLTTEWYPDLRSQADGLHRARVMEKPIHPGELRALVRAFQSDRGPAADEFDQQTRDAR